MRIVRFLDQAGFAHYGITDTFTPEPGDSVRRIDGDIFGPHRISEQRITIEKVLAPITPPAVMCIGLNYRKHAAESGSPIPEHPVLFMKNPAAVQNPGDPIELPVGLASHEVDYECELAIIIGKRCKNVPKERALDVVLGFTCANDVSARDWQRRWGGSQWCRGKTFDTFCPLGPTIVTTDEVGNPNALRLRTLLNGQVMQDSNTADMIFNVQTLIAFLSGSTTLLPGTVIITGTPEGVGMGRKPNVWLKAGDTVTIDIEGLGTLTNPVVEEAR